MPIAFMAASSVDTSPSPGEDCPAESVGPGEDEDDPDPADPHPDFPDDFDDDVASRESEEAVTEPPSPR